MNEQKTTGIEAAARELWRLTKNDSSDWRWDDVATIRKAEYRRIAAAIIKAGGGT